MACVFCKIIQGDIPAFKLLENDAVLAFLDLQPLSRGHALVIPKHHGAKLTDIPDPQLAAILPAARRIASALGAPDYNLLQNNGRLAHQVVDHVHFHIIPKPDADTGLGIHWPAKDADRDALTKLGEELKARI